MCMLSLRGQSRSLRINQFFVPFLRGQLLFGDIPVCRRRSAVAQQLRDDYGRNDTEPGAHFQVRGKLPAGCDRFRGLIPLAGFALTELYVDCKWYTVEVNQFVRPDFKHFIKRFRNAIIRFF